jgi:hypothetical protein
MFFHQLLVEVPHVEIEILLPVRCSTFSSVAAGIRFGLGRRFR